MSHYKILHRYTEAVIYEGEAESLKDLVNTAISKRVSLDGASLDGASLDGASLVGARLVGASLVGARLVGARLDGARLDYARLDGASLDYHFFSVSGIGSARRMTTYFVEADKIWCGCFRGTMAEFESQVIQTHSKNPRHLAEYQAAIQFLKSCVGAIPTDDLDKSRAEYAAMIANAEK